MEFFLIVFLPIAFLTLVVGGAAAFTWRCARSAGAIWMFWAPAAVIHAGWWLLPELDEGVAAIVRWFAIVWIGAILAGAILFVPFAAIKVAGRLSGRGEADDGVMITTYGTLALALGLIASVGSTSEARIREEIVAIRDLPAGLDGVRIANLADVHIGRFVTVADLGRAIRRIDARGADYLVVTGDLIDDFSQLDRTLGALETSKALPVLSILGNHERMGDIEATLAAYGRRRRTRLLINDLVDLEHEGAAIRFVGIDYPMAEDGGHVASPARQDRLLRDFAGRAFARGQGRGLTVALSHHPGFFPFAAARGARLTLAGHTHGGQVALSGRPIVEAYRYMAGRYRIGEAHLDVSRGFGHWLPLRIGVPRETVILTLVRA
ncbi:MAG TPA: metallophosphoesterase [Allosphingosinicella sp.]|jgi:hypothetical protein